MNPKSPPSWLAASALGLIFATAPSIAGAALLLHYSFDSDTGAAGSSAVNQAGADGTYVAGTSGGTIAIVPSTIGALFGSALSLTPNADGDSDLTAPHINTGGSASAFGIDPAAGTSYTAMAWVNFANQTTDNMIFGQESAGEGVLHLGSRGDQYWSGHWGDDLENAGLTSPGDWLHVAFTNDGATGSQEIFVNGVSIAGPGADANTALLVPTKDLLIGTSGNGGSFSGLIDEVKIFDTQLSQAEIVAASVIPEPTAISLAVGVLGIAAILRRRRRQA
ncbi:hypothetical protein BH23VER1_BH23VER1_13310 [soil metagenome]